MRSSRPGLFGLLCLLTIVDAVHHVPHEHAKFHQKRGDAVADDGFGSGFKAVAYYVSWAIYARDFPPQQIPASQLTHVPYAFAGINNETGECHLTDEFADVQKTWPGDLPIDHNTTNLFGNLKQLYLHKKKNRNLKTLLSIGGWTLRAAFAPALTHSPTNRLRFARTAVQLLQDLGFDGLDIDWEYPNSTLEAAALVDTCRLLRRELDAYAARHVPGAPHFLLTLAVPAGPQHFRYFDMPGLAPYVDFVNLMAYDYMGSGFADTNRSGHAQNLFHSAWNPASTNYDTHTAVEYYLNDGFPSRRLVLGMPLYGRSFAQTAGPGGNFTNATDGSWEPGVWDYKALPHINGSRAFRTYHDDEGIVASWAYDDLTRYMVSYDTPRVARQKAAYIASLGLGGAMWWETSGDKKGSESLISTVKGEFEGCGEGVEWRENVLEFPLSRYGNLREGMPGE
ncbi:glycoside hydrolase family 18 [Lecanosticta acicola]|uniref:chitinase n=1 Tax=Lecanosticta acicola TaxID=111012 RepID=A0AAI9E8G7_9PEZI|nr:glycoside hydrolase family 18 [Lecanosticta acicola]